MPKNIRNYRAMAFKRLRDKRGGILFTGLVGKVENVGDKRVIYLKCEEKSVAVFGKTNRQMFQNLAKVLEKTIKPL